MPIPIKTSWILLTILFTFDNLVSYIGIKYQSGREGNLLIAPFVEKYPELYFLCIPVTVLVMFIIVKTLTKFTEILVRKKIKISRVEQVMTGSMVIYWAIANSSLNLVFLLGYRIPHYNFDKTWQFLSVIGIISVVLYFYFYLFSSKKKSN